MYTSKCVREEQTFLTVYWLRFSSRRYTFNRTLEKCYLGCSPQNLGHFTWRIYQSPASHEIFSRVESESRLGFIISIESESESRLGYFFQSNTSPSLDSKFDCNSILSPDPRNAYTIWLSKIQQNLKPVTIGAILLPYNIKTIIKTKISAHIPQSRKQNRSRPLPQLCPCTLATLALGGADPFVPSPKFRIDEGDVF